MISLQSISKEYPDKVLFKNLSIKIKENMRLGLVGPNGAGKSTLLKILLGKETPDQGIIDISNSASIGYLPQEIIAGSDNTIMDEILANYPEISKIENEIYLISEKLKNEPKNIKLLDELASLQINFEQLEGWDIEKKAKIILGGLGFKEEDFHKKFNTFSGGWRMRCYLAGILLKEPNYLLLDEPTNHLDLHATIWMEEFLSSWKGGLIMISHDRIFLDKSINNILELNKGNGALYKGNYSNYITKREEIIKHNNKIYDNQQKDIAQKKQFIERFRAKNTKAKQVKSKIKQLEKIEHVEFIDDRNKSLKINIPQPSRSPLKVINLSNLNKSYGDNLVYDNLNLTIERGQKIALVGKNGSGKSTLLKILAKVENQTSGIMEYGPKVKSHYFAQHQIESLNLDFTIYETIFSISKGWTESQIRTYLGTFLFTSDSIQKKVKVLSGGEKSRLAIARLLVDPVELLLLDEPTNHLDIKSRDIIENALKTYNGTMVCISHDRHFINAVTNLTIEVDNKKIKSFAGNYEYYCWKKETTNTKININELKRKETKHKNKSNNYKERKVNRSKYNKLKKELSKLELDIEKITSDLRDKSISSNHEKLNELSILKNELEIKYFNKFEALESLEAEFKILNKSN